MTSLDLRLCVTDSPVGDYPEKIKCREHADKVNSLAVYPDHVHCFGCGFTSGCAHPASQPHGPRCAEFQLAALAWLLKVDPSVAATIREKYTSESIDAYRERAAQEAKRDPLPASLAALYHQQLMLGRRRHRKGWLTARGLTDETLARFQIGHDGLRFTIPLFDANGQLLAIRYRRDDTYDETGPKYSGIKGRNGLYLFPENAGLDTTELWVCEGELDAIRLWQEAIPAVTFTNGAGQTPKLPALIKEKYPRVTTLVIATDMDEPGREAARLTKQAALEAGFKDVLVLAWEGGKDVTEGLQLGTLTIR